MAKKAAAKPTAASPRLKSSSLLDTRVVYCGDNLEQLAKLPDATPGRMQKEEGRIMKPARPAILHSSFILLPLEHASHYVKVMLDQIFGGIISECEPTLAL